MEQQPKIREYTVAELMAELAKAPADAKVHLLDADTYWTIDRFTVHHDTETNVFWFHPSDYSEMTK